MSQIREELILYDKFSNTFTSYIRQAEQASGATSRTQKSIDQFSRSGQMATSVSNGFADSLRNLVGAYLGLRGIKSVLSLSDTLSQTIARIDMMNDGLQTTEEINQMIYDSAMRSRGAYSQTAMFVAKLGTLAGNAFSNNAEVVAFAEQINKQMVLSGTSTTEARGAMLQLTQAMSSGVLRGEELNSVLENTPMIAQTIAGYMGITTGKLRELAAEGEVTAEIVKNAMFSAADETNAKFEKMPMTWGQLWVKAQNIAISTFQPLLNMLSKIPSYLEENWEQVEPIVVAVGSALGVLTIMTVAQTAAQWALNSAMLASPITWIAVGIGLLVFAIYKAVDAYNEWSGASVSATGVVAGTFLALGAQILNTFIIPVQNRLANFANFIGNLFNDPIAAVKVLFLDMADTLLGYISTVAHAIEDLINAIPGMNVNITSGLDTLQNWVKDTSQKVKSESEWTEYVKRWDYFDLKDAYQSGYNWGENLSSSFSGISNGFDYSKMGTNISQIAGNTKDLKNSVSLAEEDVKMLVDMAERQYVNNVNLMTQAPVINISGSNTGNTEMDQKHLANAIKTILIEQSASHTYTSYSRVY